MKEWGVPMQVNTSRFGTVEVDDNRVITFEKGLLGFSKYSQFVLIQPADDSYFYWLQSTETPELAFVVTDPALFVPDYRVAIKNEQMDELGLESIEDAQVLVIVNKRGQSLTGNLQGPLVVNINGCRGQQLVLADRRYNTRTPLMELNNANAATA